MKKFFEEKKRSLKFKLAGPGHKLSEPSNLNSPSSSKCENEVKKRIDTEEDQSKRSAVLAAALQRSEGNIKNKKYDSQLRLKKSEVKDTNIDTKQSKDDEEKAGLAFEEEKEPSTPGVFFKCAALDEASILSRQEWNEKIRSHILDLKENDCVLGSILQIKSLNSEKEADKCISLIARYLKNIVENPDNEKYKSIRMGNPKFSANVLNKEGALDFLLAVGFEKQESDETTAEPYLNFKGVSSDLETLYQSLLEINGFQLELFRDFKVFEPKEMASELAQALPDDFFEITVADIKEQQQQRALKLERESMLMTKKMRELEKLKYAPRKPLYTRIRVRLPNEYVIQGTFSVQEPFSKLREFIGEHVILDSEYKLMSPPSLIYDIKDDEKTFQELNLQPAVQLFLKTSSETIEIIY